MPNERLSPRERKMMLLQSMDEKPQAASPRPDMMATLATLYGLQQQQQMDPLKMQALQQGMASEQETAPLKKQLLEAQIGAQTARTAGNLTPVDFMGFEKDTGKMYSEDPRVLKQAQEKAAKNAAMIEQDKVQQAGTPPSRPGPVMLAPGEAAPAGPSEFLRHAADIVGTPESFYAALHNAGSGIYDWLAKGFGSSERAIRINPNEGPNRMRRLLGVPEYINGPKTWQQK